MKTEMVVNLWFGMVFILVSVAGGYVLARLMVAFLQAVAA